jgi:hypothetical protein
MTLDFRIDASRQVRTEAETLSSVPSGIVA